MLEEVKTNTFELFISNSKQVGSYQIKSESYSKANQPCLNQHENIRSSENTFSGLMNDIKARPENGLKETIESEEDTQATFTSDEVIQSVNKISEELKNEIQNPGDKSQEPETNIQAPNQNDEHNKSEDQEINYMVLSEMKKHIDYEIETISKTIAGLDLNSPEGINQIIDLSEKLDALRKIEVLIDTKLTAIDLPTDKQFELEDIKLDTGNVNTSYQKKNLFIDNNADKKNISSEISNKLNLLTELQQIQPQESVLSTETQIQSSPTERENLETNLKSIKDLSNSVILESTKDAQIKEIKIQPETPNKELTKNLIDQERLIMLESKPHSSTTTTEKSTNNFSVKPELINSIDPQANTKTQLRPELDQKSEKQSLIQVSSDPKTTKTPIPEINLQAKTESLSSKDISSKEIINIETSQTDIPKNINAQKPNSLEILFLDETSKNISVLPKAENPEPLVDISSKSTSGIEITHQKASSLDTPSKSTSDVEIASQSASIKESKPIENISININEIKNNTSSQPNQNKTQATQTDNPIIKTQEPIANKDIFVNENIEISNIANNLKSIKDLKGKEAEATSKTVLITSSETNNTEETKAPALNLGNITKTQNQEELISKISTEIVDEMSLNEQDEITLVPNRKDGFQAEMSDMEADSFNQQSQPETQEFIQINNTEIKNGIGFKTNNKIQAHRNPVSLNELSNVLAREVVKVNPGETQELTMSLTPGDMGQIDLTISKSAGNKLEIKMVFSQENAFNTVEHKLTELRSILKSRGFEPQIELSRSESTSTDNFNRPGQDSFNEAKEEQKERILNTMPEWLRPDENESFKSTLQQII